MSKWRNILVPVVMLAIVGIIVVYEDGIYYMYGLQDNCK